MILLTLQFETMYLYTKHPYEFLLKDTVPQLSFSLT